ncbi:hypothetical protein [Bifidobacterium jacchi]|uniref:Lactococcin 972 family bacteriocin n=1 Tax=Bifidobacterium jacchi TaxID=2490545 RepID=A0A5N5RKV6_9BIFI|nr:hypothetical protein [Bifidobacterium jacchi]KAB5607952.1 hypothetical protein EHS19_03235 [Bifidobacterium jacchi]
MRYRTKIAAAGSSFAAALLAVGLAVSPALAWYHSGTWQGSSLQGSWRYNWTESHAEAAAPYAFVEVCAKQDGAVNYSRAGYRGQYRTADNRGSERNANDGAGAHIYKY